MKFRNLTAEDIEVRVQSVKETGLVLLLYKNARVDMAILDETVGPMNWQRSHELISGNLFCNVGIKAEKDSGREYGEWIWKQDVGTESNTEKEKGQASDSFKRACFCWGIGRELYTAPFIWITAQNCNIKGGKCYDDFSVKDITIKDGKIIALTINNDTMKKEVFKMGAEAPQKPTPPPQAPKTPQNAPFVSQRQAIANMCKQLKIEQASIPRLIFELFGKQLMADELSTEQFEQLKLAMRTKVQ